MPTPPNSPRGTVVLCDVFHQDRGKNHALGIGWSVCSPGEQQVLTLLTLEFPWTFENVEFSAEVGIWTYDDWATEGDALVVGELTGTLSGEDLSDEARDAPHPPTSQLVVPMGFQVELEPSTPYLVELRINGEPMSFTPFQTRPSTPDAEGDHGSTNDAPSEFSE